MVLDALLSNVHICLYDILSEVNLHHRMPAETRGERTNPEWIRYSDSATKKQQLSDIFICCGFYFYFILLHFVLFGGMFKTKVKEMMSCYIKKKKESRFSMITATSSFDSVSDRSAAE